MFGFLKNKLKSAIGRFSKKVEEEVKEEIEEVPVEVKEEKKEIKEKKEEKKKEVEVEEKDVEEIIEKKEEVKEIKEKRGFFKRLKEKVTTRKISGDKFDSLFNELEIVLMENNVAVEVIDKIKEDLKMDLVDVGITGNIEKRIKEDLRKSLEDVFNIKEINLLEEIKKKRPYVIVFFGINGSGKTTTIAKLAYLLKQNKLKCVLAASDTFRAASIEQLGEHADKLGVKLIKHNYGADPAAVAFDAIKHAEANNIDVVLIDTAGRMHSNKNLIDEMKKITRVAKPDMKIFVGEAITGNDCIEQVKEFNNNVGIDGIILAKQDVDEKGGTAISVSYVTGKPIIYLGVGQEYSDLERFKSGEIIRKLEL